jgi:acyl carrier protein
MLTVADRVKKIVAEHLCVEAEKVVPEAQMADLGADSLDAIEIVMSLEAEFNTQIDDDVAETFGTVGDLIGFMEKRV